jgi:hypothetical protein
MGERKYAVTSAMGTDNEGASDWLSWLQQRPGEVVSQVQETQAELERAQRLMKIAIGASIVTSVLAITVFVTRD